MKFRFIKFKRHIKLRGSFYVRFILVEEKYWYQAIRYKNIYIFQGY